MLPKSISGIQHIRVVYRDGVMMWWCVSVISSSDRVVIFAVLTFVLRYHAYAVHWGYPGLRAPRGKPKQALFTTHCCCLQ